jgi:2'-hydroxyisoflavone reductase
MSYLETEITRMNRRHFITGFSSVSAGFALGNPSALMASSPDMQSTGTTKQKRLLILGGSGFIGPPMVRYAVERGHEVTIFTRGKTVADLPDVEQLIGDRANNLEALKGRQWDVVLDNNARDYRWVSLTTELLRDQVEHYVYVSSISAYAGEYIGYEHVDNPWAGPTIDINSPLAQPPVDFVAGQELEYGQSKAMAEKLVHQAFPSRATVVRPGYIVGPGDPTDRFTYWPVRINAGGEVLAPGDGSDATQIIDVRDLDEWIVRLAEQGTHGDFNGVGLASPPSMAELLYGIRATTTREVAFTWASIPFLREQGVEPYSDMPIWTPADPLSAVDNSHAVTSGLTFRPLAVTARDTLSWHQSRPDEQQAELRTGIKADRERKVLEAWHRYKSA